MVGFAWLHQQRMVWECVQIGTVVDHQELGCQGVDSQVHCIIFVNQRSPFSCGPNIICIHGIGWDHFMVNFILITLIFLIISQYEVGM
jgi:hypothetical protein